MEQAHQKIDINGLQIPLPLMQRYGLQIGAQVVLELGTEGIRVLPAVVDRSEIEGRALRYLLRNLGDAVSIYAEQIEDRWQVTVFASGRPMPLGDLVYGLAGDLQEERSTPLETMRRQAAIVTLGE
jgi:hypothetical protein